MSHPFDNTSCHRNEFVAHTMKKSCHTRELVTHVINTSCHTHGCVTHMDESHTSWICHAMHVNKPHTSRMCHVTRVNESHTWWIRHATHMDELHTCWIGRGACVMATCEHPTHHINWHTCTWRTDPNQNVGDRARTGQHTPGAFCLILLHLTTIYFVRSAFKMATFLPHMLKIKQYQEFWWILG